MTNILPENYPTNRDSRVNWPLAALIALVPIQNIYLGKIPSLGGGINILNVLMLVAFLVASARRETTYRTPLNRYIVFLGTSYLFSLVIAISVLGWDEKSPFILKDMFFSYLFFFVTYKSITGMKSLKIYLWATIIPLPYMFKVFYSNLSWMGFSSYQDKLRSNSGTFMNLGSNEIAAFYATYTFVILGIVLTESEKKRKWFLLACIAMNAYSLIYSFSRGGYLAILAGCLVYCWYSNKIRQLLAVIVMAIALQIAGVDVFPKAVTERFSSSFVENEEMDEGAQTRLILWQIAIDKFVGSPLVGVGFGNFKKLNEYKLDSHNYYVKLLAEGGVISFSAFIAFLIASYRTTLTLFKTTDDVFMAKLSLGFLACIAALAVGNLFGDRFTHYPLISYFYVYLAMIIKGLDWSVDEQQQPGINLTTY